MSPELSIEILNLNKIYKLYENAGYRLREALNPFRRKYHHEFSALKNINITIPKGQVVGIIGRNGSGKSTLLKIITGVLTPTSGTVNVSGKVAALLELGAGFNPELTGRENIFLNGSLMGFSEKEMQARSGEIIEFANIDQFIDQPVKMYSSGMFVRLAFAVAISVSPDILVIDEALSVGDVRFQQKCIRKIREFFDLGKTVIFVGHDLSLINSFCSHCIWINEGEVVASGSPKVITKEYLSFMAYGMTSKIKKADVSLNPDGWFGTESFESFGDKNAVISSLRITEGNGTVCTSILGNETVKIEMRIESKATIDQPIIGFIVKDRLGNHIFGGNTFVHEIEWGPLTAGDTTYSISFRMPSISNGDYTLSISLANGTQHDHVQIHWIHDCFQFKVMRPDLRYQIGDGLVMDGNFNFLKES